MVYYDHFYIIRNNAYHKYLFIFIHFYMHTTKENNSINMREYLFMNKLTSLSPEIVLSDNYRLHINCNEILLSKIIPSIKAFLMLKICISLSNHFKNNMAYPKLNE